MGNFYSRKGDSPAPPFTNGIGKFNHLSGEAAEENKEISTNRKILEHHSGINSRSKSVSCYQQSNIYGLSPSRSIHFYYKRYKGKHQSQYTPKTSITYWPVLNIEALFLPEFKLVTSGVREKYTILNRISNGSFGVVFKVKERETNALFALKVVDKSKIVKNGGVQQLKDEVSIQTKIGHHSFIASCLDFWQNRHSICLLIDFIERGEIFDNIKPHEFTYELVQLYVAEIAIALDFLHNAGIIYRDLKPENILLDEDYHIKLIDFGLSKWLKIGGRVNSFCGTVDYMAPEMIKRQSYGHAVDWWALGIIACLMITNKYPEKCLLSDNKSVVIPFFETDHTHQSSNPFKTNKAYSSAGKDLLHRLLDANPQQRLRSVMALERIAMFKGYNFKDVKQKKIRPIDLMKERTRSRLTSK